MLRYTPPPKGSVCSVAENPGGQHAPQRNPSENIRGSASAVMACPYAAYGQLVLRNQRPSLGVSLLRNIQELHQIGTSLSRAGNNINQLAKHANGLNKIGCLNESIIDRLNIVLGDYNANREKIRIAFRRIIREMAKRWPWQFSLRLLFGSLSQRTIINKY